MTTPLATGWLEVGDLTGPPGVPGVAGPPGTNGVSITGAAVNSSGDLIIDLSSGGQVNAGHVAGAPGGGIDFEASVAAAAALPATAPYGEARYVVADGHLYVYEAAADRPQSVDGWTDVGAIRGEPGATGPAGANGTDGVDGVSVSGAAIDGAGHLILTLSTGGPIDAGVARGPAGTAGTNGTDGEQGIGVIAYPSGPPPAATTHRVGTIAIGGDGKLLRAIA